MSTRSLISLVSAIHNLNDMGLDCSDILKKYGFSMDHLDPFGLIDRATELKILHELVPKIDDPMCGLKLGQKFSLVGYGPFTLMLMTAPNAYEACRMGVQYQDLTYLYGTIELDLSPNQSGLNIFVSPLPDSVRDFLIDRDIAGTYQLLLDILKIINETVELKAVWIPHSDNGLAKEYEAFFDCPVIFDAPYSHLEISNVNLGQTFPQANPLAFNLYKSQCDALLLERAQTSSNLADQVLAYLELFEYQFPKLEEVATLFGISPRSLRRHLKDEDSSFQQLLNQIRFTKAKTFLSKTQLPIEAIADRLGYSEPASFNHAFTRWSGRSPSHFRRSN
ncbi:AraC family transcriptional regulator [Litoribrevibacter albus]|uniref:AraC family transcriptional regulator n=1 Tax=Litoribrevibacter albus TaxID=1473156 RepID=A0AA37W817_9GAMM|nr:AraC family transcriptional regulator [Litoribrevibacter albus]GLQ32023.1 AraC family transcriptional regulator [Litoribrevibacter albus]